MELKESREGHSRACPEFVETLPATFETQTVFFRKESTKMVNKETQEASELKVTSENLQDWRRAVATLREKKGQEEVALQLIRFIRREAQKLGEHDHVVNLFWEESLVGQHIVMSERDKPEEQRDEIKKTVGMQTMWNSTSEAQKYIVQHNLSHLLSASYRFLGRVSTYKGDHEEAKKYYEQSRDLYLAVQDPVEKARYLELQAFLSHSLIMTGNLEEGLGLARSTNQSFFESGEGKALKEVDYFTWAVWASGVPIHIAHALFETGNLSRYREELKTWLDKANAILEVPQGITTWGDEKFEIRRNEIEAIKRDLD